MIRSSRFRQYLIALGSVLLVARVSAAQVTYTFSNPTPLTVPSTGPTSPYGTTITVSGVRGTVTNVAVTVKDVSHGDPGQLRLILVGPTGQTAALLEGTGVGEFLPQPAASHSDLAFSSRSSLSFTSTYPAPGPLQAGGLESRGDVTAGARTARAVSGNARHVYRQRGEWRLDALRVR